MSLRCSFPVSVHNLHCWLLILEFTAPRDELAFRATGGAGEFILLTQQRQFERLLEELLEGEIIEYLD